MREELKKYFEKNFPEEHQAIFNSFEKEPAKFIRINTLKISISELIERMKEDGFEFEKTIIDEVFIVKKEPYSIGASKEHLLGYFYIQDLISVIPVLELSPKKDELVLDMTAAPGGKTTFISQLMKNKGVVIALDKKTSKLKSLKSNLSRMGVSNCIVFHMNAKNVKKLNLQFDKILLDAPCSNSGTLSKNSNLKETLTPEIFKQMQERQKTLIEAAFSVLREHGTLVYSTCSLSIEENEDVLEYAEKIGLKLEKPRLCLGKASKISSLARRVFPFEHNTQGFFYAKMVKQR